MQVLRTPDERFQDLPGYPFEPHYANVPDAEGGALRIHYLDEGPRGAPPLVLLHGEPSWSYLYRTMIPVLAGAGFRVVAPDLVGFGRSDKPAQVDDYTYVRHVEWGRQVLFDALDLDGVTLFCQDWGGLIGLRLVAERPDRFARVCAANTGLPDGSRRLPEAWWVFRNFVANSSDVPVGRIVSGGVVNPLPPEIVSAYDSPFPDPSYQGGVRAFPDLIPQTADNPATPDNQRAWESLARFDKPFLCAFSDADPVTAGGERALLDRIPGTAGQPHRTLHGGHFLQEDCGPELAELLISWAG